MNAHCKAGASPETMGEEELRRALAQFLFSAGGSRYRFAFAFDSPLECGGLAPNMKVGELSLISRPYSYMGAPLLPVPIPTSMF